MSWTLASTASPHVRGRSSPSRPPFSGSQAFFHDQLADELDDSSCIDGLELDAEKRWEQRSEGAIEGAVPSTTVKRWESAASAEALAEMLAEGAKVHTFEGGLAYATPWQEVSGSKADILKHDDVEGVPKTAPWAYPAPHPAATTAPGGCGCVVSESHPAPHPAATTAPGGCGCVVC